VDYAKASQPFTLPCDPRLRGAGNMIETRDQAGDSKSGTSGSRPNRLFNYRSRIGHPDVEVNSKHLEIGEAATLPLMRRDAGAGQAVLSRRSLTGRRNARRNPPNPQFLKKLSFFLELRSANPGETGKGCNHESKGAGLSVRNFKYSILDFTCCKGKGMRDTGDLDFSRPTEGLIGKTWNPKNEKKNQN